jgi:hypothetical protein
VERGNTVLVVEQENAANLDGQASAVSPQRRRQGCEPSGHFDEILTSRIERNPRPVKRR